MANGKEIKVNLILLIILVLLIGALPAWPYSAGWGYYPSGALGTILIVVLILRFAWASVAITHNRSEVKCYFPATDKDIGSRFSARALVSARALKRPTRQRSRSQPSALLVQHYSSLKEDQLIRTRTGTCHVLRILSTEPALPNQPAQLLGA